MFFRGSLLLYPQFPFDVLSHLPGKMLFLDFIFRTYPYLTTKSLYEDLSTRYRVDYVSLLYVFGVVADGKRWLLMAADEMMIMDC